MTMQFFSTRDQNRKVTSSQAIAQGLSDEGGLFVPESFPQVDVKALCGLDYPALAAASGGSGGGQVRAAGQGAIYRIEP